MGSGNEQVYVVPGTNVFECLECGREKCTVHVPISLEQFTRIETYGPEDVQADGRICARQQTIKLQRPSPPPGLSPQELSKLIKMMMRRLKTQGRE